MKFKVLPKLLTPIIFNKRLEGKKVSKAKEVIQGRPESGGGDQSNLHENK